MFSFLRYVLPACFLLISTTTIAAEPSPSPWLFTPTVSSDPKVGTAVGAMGAYLHKFDKHSPASMFGATASYSSTKSVKGGVFGRAYLNNDTQRIMGGLFGGYINNDYQDFLGSGLPVSTNDDMRFAALRYLHRVAGDWFLGGHVISTNYQISSDDPFTGDMLDLLGLTGFRSNGLGLVIQHDTRDNQNSPSIGHNLEAFNVAFREGLGGDVSFDSYTGSYAGFHNFDSPHVLAYRVKGRWTSDAPKSGYSSIELRGYTRGQYLAPHSTLAEVEGRFHIKGRFGANLFSGIACLYGSGTGCGNSENLYPNIGAGLTYQLKPEEKMVVRAEYAQGKSGNKGFYLQFGQAF
ncbi:hypothetical protein SNR37_003623 [Agarivorans aestuarii]|uniref:Bacterial surface antigen (D15) domain-containing protein n=1 Tax=Agarivorans aestuarii TaxID=1563703 RepID=A0ABU7G470_9ALTE|nr:hypothetical protein [Agarivorans aestuarii]MEE1674187.1 hypothetical protein [Agarivorans aestuarii]